MSEETVFASGKLIFPKLKDGKLDTIEFLEAAKGVVSLVGKVNFNLITYHEFKSPLYHADLFGALFSVVKMDMNGNIQVTYISNLAKEKN